MAKPKASLDSRELAETAVRGIQEKKGKDIVFLDLRKIENAVCDYFIICHGDSDRQVAAIADSVEEEVRENLNEKPWHTEGYQNAQWILMDYVDVLVHVFHRDTREFYRLEELWADAEKIAIEYAYQE